MASSTEGGERDMTWYKVRGVIGPAPRGPQWEGWTLAIMSRDLYYQLQLENSNENLYSLLPYNIFSSHSPWLMWKLSALWDLSDLFILTWCLIWMKFWYQWNDRNSIYLESLHVHWVADQGTQYASNL